jgi:hypothetical protein
MLDMAATPSASAATAASTLPIKASFFDDGDGAQSKPAILPPASPTPEAPVPGSERGGYGEGTLSGIVICPLAQ